MLEPRAGRVALIVAFGYALAVSFAIYWGWDRVPTLSIPVVASALPFAAMTGRQGATLRLLAVVLLFLWVVLGLASVGLFYLPAVLAMSIAHQGAKKANAHATDGS